MRSRCERLSRLRNRVIGDRGSRDKSSTVIQGFGPRIVDRLFDGYRSEVLVKNMDGKHGRKATMLRDTGCTQILLRRDILSDPKAEPDGVCRLKGVGNSELEANTWPGALSDFCFARHTHLR